MYICMKIMFVFSEPVSEVNVADSEPGLPQSEEQGPQESQVQEPQLQHCQGDGEEHTSLFDFSLVKTEPVLDDDFNPNVPPPNFLMYQQPPPLFTVPPPQLPKVNLSAMLTSTRMPSPFMIPPSPAPVTCYPTNNSISRSPMWIQVDE